ncbi:SUMF1/EgtB/PvdO family nonheme iron enzyme [Desulfococcaceae bacterium HSG7]|nr:SUMF1/EgtB/PvdO family nonheme iron enzyme [Desulfococcaceae bacterium HSG7]
MQKTLFVTFYSYKGGVGRTLALGNVAWEAALRGKKVVVIDFDLEAPGIPKLIPFRDPVKAHLEDRKNKSGGLFEFIQYFQRNQIITSLPDFYAAEPIIDDDFEQGGEIFIVPAGYEDFEYKDELQAFNWEKFYEHENGNELFHNFRDAVAFQFDDPDLVLIDSRTGLTDIGGICTLLLPDKVVVLTGLNEQNIYGCKDVIDTIDEHSKHRIADKYLEPIDIILAASHVPENQEIQLCKQRIKKAVEVFERKIDVTLPYVPILSLEERLLIQEQGRDNAITGSIVQKYRELSALITKPSEQYQQTANDIIASVINFPDEPPFKRWRLAGHTMLDIRPNRRIDSVLVNVKNRMLEIMGSDATPVIRAESSEILGWLGDDRDLKEFIPIPAGKYSLSQGKRFIKAFEIAKYPVTNAWFAEFIDVGGYENPAFWSDEGQKWLKNEDVKQPRLWDDRKWNCPNAPTVGVCWYEADAFCRWLTLKRQDGWVYRLPDENKWEAAAAGFDKRKYPWGDEWKEGRCNSSESEIKKTSSVGIFKNGDTPKGVADMAGNVWEWTHSDHESDNILDDFTFEENWNKATQLPVLRGGSWYGYRNDMRCANRYRNGPNDRGRYVGLRCFRTKI